jgi:hypothetical protein
LRGAFGAQLQGLLGPAPEAFLANASCYAMQTYVIVP